MTRPVHAVSSDLSQIGADAEESFGHLSEPQLNWKPSATSWSVAQCLDHLIQTQRHYLPLFERLAAGDTTRSLWERISPFSGFLGRLMIQTVHPETQKKVKTFGKAVPSASEFDGRIVERFVAHQAELAEHVGALPDDLDLSTIITSPLLGLVTYSLSDGFSILVFHGQRHLDQARRVTETEGFPA